MQSKAATVEQYLAQLPDDRRVEIERVRAVILANLDRSGLEEGMQYGMIGYFVPHRLFPDGYHCDPKVALPWGGLAAQKGHCSLYLMGLYMADMPGSRNAALSRWFHDAWKKSGKKLDMGKSCIRFRKADDLALDVLGEAVRRIPAKDYINWYREVLDMRTKKGPTPRAEIRKATAKRKVAKASAKQKGSGAKRRGVPKQALPNRGNRRGK
jgi:hypothetical protein